VRSQYNPSVVDVAWSTDSVVWNGISSTVVPVTSPYTQLFTNSFYMTQGSVTIRFSVVPTTASTTETYFDDIYLLNPASNCSCLGNKTIVKDACLCTGGNYKSTEYYNHFESLNDVTKISSMVSSDLIVDKAQCVSGGCAKWRGGYTFDPIVFGSRNIFSMSFWVKESVINTNTFFRAFSFYNSNYWNFATQVYNGRTT